MQGHVGFGVSRTVESPDKPATRWLTTAISDAHSATQHDACVDTWPDLAGTPVALGDCYGTFHGTNHPATVGVVLCAGVLNDGCTGYRSLRQLAAALGDAGYPTLRYDYPGTGNSLDPSDPDLLIAWKRSVHDAIAWLQTNAGIRNVVLVGFRFGSLLASLIASERPDVRGLVLLAPYIRGRSFLRQMSIEANILSGGRQHEPGLGLQGLALGPSTMEQIAALDLRKIAIQPSCRVSIFVEAESPVLSDLVASWRGGGVAVETCPFDGLEALLRPSFMCHEPSIDSGRIVDRLSRTLPPCRGEQAAALAPVAVRMRSDGFIESPLRFGPDNRLFGVLCRPATDDHAKTAVIMVNSSGNPHHGFARLAVNLARRLAAGSFASLRMDFAGLGDGLAPGDAETHCFATDRTSDIRAAVDCLERLGYTRFGIEGLCSGAYHAFHGALADTRISDAFLLNIPLFAWREGDPVEFLDHAIQSPARFLPKLLSGDVWKRILAGELGLQERLGMQLGWCYGWAKSWFWRIVGLAGIAPPPDVALRRIRDLAAGTRTIFLHSPGDESIGMVARAFASSSPPPTTELQVMDGADHSFTVPEIQSKVADLMIKALTEKRTS